jgi:hypothetical protein
MLCLQRGLVGVEALSSMTEHAAGWRCWWHVYVGRVSLLQCRLLSSVPRLLAADAASVRSTHQQ